MSLLCRIKQSRIHSLPSRIRQCVFSQAPSITTHSSDSKARVFQIQDLGFRPRPTEFCSNVRFFAAPVQVKPKEEVKDSGKPRMNEKISAEYVRLVDEDGNHAVVSRRVALDQARTLKLDLVEVDRNAKPPVCKIMDYHREKYKQQLREKDRTKSKSETTLKKGACKEVRFTEKTEQKDLKTKADMVKRMMEKGYRVKCMATGTEDQDLGGLLARMSALIEDVAFVESGPMVERRQAFVVVRHVKFGASKGKKSSNAAGATTSEVKKGTSSGPTMSPNFAEGVTHAEEGWDPTESGSETAEEIEPEESESPLSHTGMPDQNLAENKSSWSISDANDDFEKLFASSTDEPTVSSLKEDLPEQTKVSTPLHQRPFLEPIRASTGTSSTSSQLVTGENRYASNSRSRISQTNYAASGNDTSAKHFNPRGPAQTNHTNNSPGVSNSARFEPRFMNRGGQPWQESSASSPRVDTDQSRTDASAFRNLQPGNQFPNQGRYGPATTNSQTDPSAFRNLRPANESPTPNQGHSQPAATSSPASSAYGIFSSQTATLGKQQITTKSSVNQEGHPATNPRSPSPSGISANDGRRQGVEMGGQGKWGIFSRDNSKTAPNRISEGQH
ncbi:Translation initiation factor 3, N-terminal [Dillenia turbinata]|uniref:Translation initiation factor 3, N-terminal n=1 Tax=Dillenia turbinata TaxID=194707 RepID=A0AAN8YYB6_9MAGN